VNLNIFGILALVAMVSAGVGPILFGVWGFRRTTNRMLQILSVLAIVVGAVFLVMLAVAIGLHREPWTPMLVLVIVGVVVAAVVFWAGALADCLLNEPSDGMGKLVWVLAIVLTFVVGAAIYYLGQRPRRLRQQNR
jgi:hypothetical protein